MQHCYHQLEHQHHQATQTLNIDIWSHTEARAGGVPNPFKSLPTIQGSLTVQGFHPFLFRGPEKTFFCLGIFHSQHIHIVCTCLTVTTASYKLFSWFWYIWLKKKCKDFVEYGRLKNGRLKNGWVTTCHQLRCKPQWFLKLGMLGVGGPEKWTIVQGNLSKIWSL